MSTVTLAHALRVNNYDELMHKHQLIMHVAVTAQSRPGLELLDDTTSASCYTNAECTGRSLAATTVGSCCDNSVDPIGYSYITDSDECQACPTG